MDNKKIEALFERLSNLYPCANDETKNIFKTLVQLTLEYRDQLAKTNDTITVEEVQNALDELVTFLKEKSLSKDIPQKQLELVTRWLQVFTEQAKH
ncbi:hypothetical protein KKA47_03945 [bacterium]|nr:hypothetical protein [bacterium]